MGFFVAHRSYAPCIIRGCCFAYEVLRAKQYPEDQRVLQVLVVQKNNLK